MHLPELEKMFFVKKQIVHPQKTTDGHPDKTDTFSPPLIETTITIAGI